MEKNLKMIFRGIYREYLKWFEERAQETARPIDEEEMIDCQICHEDIFENSNYLLNRMFFLIPLAPSQSRSGTLEAFAFSEMNLMLKGPGGDADDVLDIYPVEYRREQFR